MPRPGGRNVPEKSKDFFGSMKRLLINLKPWRIIMIIALTLAMVSAILSLIAPNKLSDFTDTISKGLVPKTEKLSEISAEISKNLNAEKLNSKLLIINNDKNIKLEDKELLQNTLMNIQNQKDKETAQKAFLALPDSILTYLLEDIEYEGKKISVEDQITTLHLFAKMNGEEKTEKALELIDELPKSIYNIIKPEIDMQRIKQLDRKSVV